MKFVLIDPETIRTDADIVAIARRMVKLQAEIRDCIDVIEASQHPNAAQLAEGLLDECCFFAWPTHVIHKDLKRPDRWETNLRGPGLGIVGKAGSKAAMTREHNRLQQLLAED